MVPRGLVLLSQQLLKLLELPYILLVPLLPLGYSGLQILNTPSSKTLEVDFEFLLVFSARGSR